MLHGIQNQISIKSYIFQRDDKDKGDKTSFFLHSQVCRIINFNFILVDFIENNWYLRLTNKYLAGRDRGPLDKDHKVRH